MSHKNLKRIIIGCSLVLIVLVLDQAGWHTAKNLTVPANITPVASAPIQP